MSENIAEEDANKAGTAGSGAVEEGAAGYTEDAIKSTLDLFPVDWFPVLHFSLVTDRHHGLIGVCAIHCSLPSSLET